MPAGTAVWKLVVPGGAGSVQSRGTEALDAADLVSLPDIVVTSGVAQNCY